MLVTGQHPGYSTAMSAAAALCNAAVRLGWTYSQFDAELSQPDILARKWLANSSLWLKWWLDSEDYILRNPLPENAAERMQRVGEIRAAYAASTTPMPSTRRVILEDLHQVATDRHTDTILAGRRDIYVRTGISLRTIGRSLDDLVDWRWLTRLSHGTATQAALYRLSMPPVNRCAKTPHVPEGDRALGVLSGAKWHTRELAQLAGTDVFAQTAGRPDVGRGLGRSAARVYAALAEADTPAAIVNGTGMPRRTVMRHLAVLVDEGLAVRQGQGVYVRVEVDDWDGLAARMGTAGQAAARAGRVARERAAHGETLVGRRQARSRPSNATPVPPVADLAAHRKSKSRTRRAGRKHRNTPVSVTSVSAA